MPKKHKKSGQIKKKVKPQKIAPPMPKGKQLKKIVKQKTVKFQPKQPLKKPTLNKPKVAPKPKSKPKPKIEPLPPTKPYIPLFTKKVDSNTSKKPLKKKKNTLAWM